MQNFQNNQKILVISSGQTSIKFILYLKNNKEIISEGKVKNIKVNGDCKLFLHTCNLKEEVINLNDINSHDLAIVAIIKIFTEKKIINDVLEISAVGHKIVSGANIFTKSEVITANNFNEILKLNSFAPLYNPINLLCYQGFLKAIPNAKHIAIFDTAFHNTIAEENFLYPIPFSYYQENHIRNYGSHGTSYRYVLNQYNNLINKNPNNSQDQNLIMCHVGGGVSVCAIKNNKSFATSAGFTPLGGNIMATRSGDIDPSVIFSIAKTKDIAFSDIEYILSYQSGLKGITGHNTGSILEVIKEKNNKSKQATYAWNMFINSIIKYIAAYYFLFQGNVDAIIFTGEVSESIIDFRKEIIPIIANTLKINIDQNNFKKLNEIVKFNANKSQKPLIYVIPTNEASIIFDDTINLIKD